VELDVHAFQRLHLLHLAPRANEMVGA
jgi:hypothetical protein